MRKIIFSCFLAILVISTNAYSQDKATEQEVSAMKALLEKKKMSEDQVNKMLDNFREMPKMQRDNMMDQMKAGLKKDVPKKDETGEIDGVQRGKPNMENKGEIDGVQRGKPNMEDKGEIDGIQRGKPNMDQMKEKGNQMKEKGNQMKEKGEEMKEKGQEMMDKGNSVKEDMKEKGEKMKEKMNEMKSEGEKMNQGGKKDWSKISGKEFGKATSEWAKSRGKKYGQLKERAGKMAVRMDAASSKIEKAKERLLAKKESGEISEEEYNTKMAQLAKYEERIKALDVKAKGKAELLKKVEQQSSSLNIEK